MTPDLSSVVSFDQISQALDPFIRGQRLPAAQLERIRAYVELLLLWNRSMSLTAIEDPVEIIARHFGESILAAAAVPIRKGRLADVGSGAGFPGLPLKIVSDELDVVLIEPNQKKCAFLSEVKRKLAIAHVEISRSRYEQYPAKHETRFDFITSRALGDYRHLLKWAQTALAPGGKIVLWLGDEDSILIGRTASWSWELPIRIPESSRRVIHIGRPIST